MKRFSLMIALIVLIASLPFTAAAEKESYVWVLKEVVEYGKSSEIEDYNQRNAGKYSLNISGAKGNFVFSLHYLGAAQEQDENGRHLREGDSASSAVIFGGAPETLKPGELTPLSVDLRLISDNTYDKAYDFLPTKATAFFDKPGARPDIPSSNAVYFEEKEGEEKGLAVGTKSGMNSSISASLYAKAPEINDERKMALCVCAEGILAVGTKYVYELMDEQDLAASDAEQTAYRKAFVRDITGTVFGVRGDKNRCNNNDAIADGTSVKTEAASGCELYFDDKSYFRISAESELMLSKTEAKDTVIRLISGKAWAYIQPVVYNGSFTVEMKYAALKIKGTIFAVEEGQDYSAVWLFTGYAAVISAKTGELTEIQAGQKATFRPDGSLQLAYFNVHENIGQWGIPVSAIREDSGYAWVRHFVIVLAVFTVAVIAAIFLTICIKKRKKKKANSNTTPKEGQCQFCGNPLEPDETFCKMCGAAVKRPKASDANDQL